MSKVIKNGTIVTADRTWKADVLLQHGKIVAIGSNLRNHSLPDLRGGHPPASRDEENTGPRRVSRRQNTYHQILFPSSTKTDKSLACRPTRLRLELVSMEIMLFWRPI